MKWISRAYLLAGAAWIAGCQTGPMTVSSQPPRPVDKVDNVALRVSPPMPLNWDDRPGVDGLQAQVNLFQLEHPLSVTVEGALEFALYEGQSDSRGLAGREPFRTWTFQGPELRRFLNRSLFGWDYAVRLDWGNRPPTSSSVTLIARYRPVRGQDVLSSPLHVAMVPK